jgi:antitoxin HicB
VQGNSFAAEKPRDWSDRQLANLFATSKNLDLAPDGKRFALPIRFRPPTMKVMKRSGTKTLSYSVFYEQAPEGGYVALVPALPGCHTQGETLEETESNVKEAIALYLESLSAHGDAIPVEGPSFQGRVTIPA